MKDYTPSEKAIISICVIGGTWIELLIGTFLVFVTRMTPIQFAEHLLSSNGGSVLFAFGWLLFFLALFKLTIGQRTPNQPTWLLALESDPEDRQTDSLIQKRNRKNERYASFNFLVAIMSIWLLGPDVVLAFLNWAVMQ